MSSKPNILFYPHIKYKAQFFLRYLWPASRLAKNGFNVKVKDPRLHGLWTPEMMADDFVWADVIVAFYPKTRSGERLLEICESMHKKLVVDSDDYSFGVHPSNTAYGFSGTKDIDGIWTSGIQWRKDLAMQNHARWVEVMAHCDGMSVTTPELANLYAPFIGHHKMFVLPNSLDLSVYKPWKRTHGDEIRIGWQGGASHFVDIKIVRDALNRITSEFNNVKLVFMGQIWTSMKRDFPNAEFHQWVDSDTYPLKLGSLDIDIGICPIEDNLFSRGKSNLKMLEYGVFNAPSVCSKIPMGPYNDTKLDGVDRVLVENNEEDWYLALKNLVEDKEKRQFIGANARNTVERLYNIDITWKYWAECYEEVNKGMVELAI